MNTILTDDERRAMLGEAWAFTETTPTRALYTAQQVMDSIAKAEAAVLAKLREQEPVAWLYRCEPWFDGNRWQEQSGVTLDEQVAKFKGDPKPLYAAPLPAVVQVPQPWRDFVAEVVASAEGYERRTGQKVNAEWVQRGRAMLAAPEAPAQDEHITDGTPCWCDPELDYKDPETGAEVWVHRGKQ